MIVVRVSVPLMQAGKFVVETLQIDTAEDGAWIG